MSPRGKTLAAVWVFYAIFAFTISFPLANTHLGTLLATSVHTLTVLVAVFLLIWTCRKQQNKKIVTAHLLLAAALTLGVLVGILTLLFFNATGDELSTEWSVLDTAYLGIIPLIAIALLMFPVASHAAGSVIRTILDGLLGGLGLWVILYIVWLMPLEVHDKINDATLISALVYPAADVFIIGMAASVASRVASVWRKQILILLTGLILWALSDILYIIQVANETYSSASWVAAIGQGGLILICIGATVKPEKMYIKRSVNQLFSAIPFIPVIITWFIGVGIIILGIEIPKVGRFAIFMLMGLLIGRMLVGWWDRTRLTKRLTLTDRLYEALVTESFEAIAVFTKEGNLVYGSPSVYKGLTKTYGDVEKVNVLQWIHPEEKRTVNKTFIRVANTPGTKETLTVRLKTTNEEYRWTQIVLHNMCNDEAVQGIVANGRDVHSTVTLQKDLAYAATHDSLTHLGNMLAGRTELTKLYEQKEPGFALLVDLDGFKNVNDAYGHHVGDKVLIKNAQRLKECVKDENAIYRLGGDEFLIIVNNEKKAYKIAQQIVETSRETIQIGPISAVTPASIGIAKFSDANNVDELLRNADLAMYTAKGRGKDQWETYEDWMHNHSVNRMTTIGAIRASIADSDPKKLKIVYQPIVDLKRAKMVGAEALVRLVTPSGEELNPAQFIPIAEDIGIITTLGEQILDRVCADIAEWKTRNIKFGRINVNVSRKQMNTEIVNMFKKVMKKHGIKGEDLCIELTESAVLTNIGLAETSLNDLRKLGIQIALDDFGTGESSLSQIKHLPIDVVKIDKEFITNARSEKDWELVKSIMNICNQLELPVVAEGIEHEKTITTLLEHGCQWGQGYFYSKGVEKIELENYAQLYADKNPIDYIKQVKRSQIKT